MQFARSVYAKTLVKALAGECVPQGAQRRAIKSDMEFLLRFAHGRVPRRQGL